MAVRAHAESAYNDAHEARFIRELGTWSVGPNPGMSRLLLLKKYRLALSRRHYSFAAGLPLYEATRQGLLELVDEEIRSESGPLVMPTFSTLRN